MKLIDYRTLVFDCDGVILDSNRIKTEAFRQAALPYGAAAADALVTYHLINGGISRYAKFEYFLKNIIKGIEPNSGGLALQSLLKDYAIAVKEGLMECAVCKGLGDLREAMPNQTWLIVSGGDQTELREIFAARGIDHYFDGGIFGSPDSKEAILSREQAAQTITPKALFLGDSTYDYRASHAAGIDFVFVSGWSELPDWAEFIRKEKISSVSSISELSIDFSL
ncbi:MULTISPECIES: HAD family hydrolase [unclassified Sulfitobacter]|uniref:HAD family hydrolase n=1 Tax=unclassified Sulfitobacter TaxID=196795 RepID=UPI00374752E6